MNLYERAQDEFRRHPGPANARRYEIAAKSADLSDKQLAITLREIDVFFVSLDAD